MLRRLLSNKTTTGTGTEKNQSIENLTKSSPLPRSSSRLGSSSSSSNLSGTLSLSLYPSNSNLSIPTVGDDDLTDRSTEASDRSLDEIYVPKTFKCLNCGSYYFISQLSLENHQFCGKDCLSSFSLFHTLPSTQKFGLNQTD
jgi:hypothetical protein